MKLFKRKPRLPTAQSLTDFARHESHRRSATSRLDAASPATRRARRRFAVALILIIAVIIGGLFIPWHPTQPPQQQQILIHLMHARMPEGESKAY